MGESHLHLLRRILDRLSHYAENVSRSDLDTDLDTLLMVSRAIEVAAQCCVDLAMTLLARRGLGIPETYREAFSLLAQNGLITPELAGVLQGWAGIRNVLAHMYAEVDLDLLYAALTSDREPLEEFGRIAARELLDDAQ